MRETVKRSVVYCIVSLRFVNLFGRNQGCGWRTEAPIEVSTVPLAPIETCPPRGEPSWSPRQFERRKTMKQKLVLCTMLLLIAFVDIAVAKGSPEAAISRGSSRAEIGRAHV